MPINGLSNIRRIPREGKIRLGEKKKSPSGKEYCVQFAKKRGGRRVKRIEIIRNMTTREIAEKIVDLNISGDYCDSDCEPAECDRGEREIECCVKWLEEEGET